MKKVFLSLFCIVLLVTIVFTGCSQSDNESSYATGGTEALSVSDESTVENSSLSDKQVSGTEKAETSSDNNKTTKSSDKDKITTNKTTSSKAKSSSAKITTTANKATTKKVTTTKKKTTTKKTTTTKKKTTTTKKVSHCTNNNNHSMSCGNMGRWFNSRSDLFDYYMSVSDIWTSKFDRGEIDYDTMVENCPGGYECWSCSYCGKWTGNFKYR